MINDQQKRVKRHETVLVIVATKVENVHEITELRDIFIVTTFVQAHMRHLLRLTPKRLDNSEQTTMRQFPYTKHELRTLKQTLPGNWTSSSRQHIWLEEQNKSGLSQRARRGQDP
jgi:hypothetical protein